MDKYAVSVVEDDLRLVWESPDYDDYETGLNVFQSECQKSGYEVLLYGFKNNEWQIIKDRPQLF